MRTPRQYCPQCAGKIEQRKIEELIRDYCPRCDKIYYDNPLPVVSALVVNHQKEVLLVLRDREPKAGMWALPSGFVELGETIEQATLRELKEETGITGKILHHLDTTSYVDPFYGDLIWITFEVKWVSGTVAAGDDARRARSFPIFNLPELAFPPNTRVIQLYHEKMNFPKHPA